ncbi:M20 family metallopeptidase [Clostridium sp.]|uniref:M20 metallopeptidase family protein n=1 Tax=Clostridium sp. TaxID=1506 RepID=UPI0026DC77A8|nr:M20 family metallopeptidase [Clostridium sp.]MDO5040403.1 M20 family metallopeptidase [Clostridium sp.]
MNYWERANEIKDDIISYRRNLHSNAEVGMDLPSTTKFIMEKLKSFGYKPKQIINSGVVATIGNGNGPCILLRADMDALPMTEESGLKFCSRNLGSAHTCGHDLHSAMLLGAAKMLKENEENINGTIKLMFQPGEETFQGAKAMIDAGLLENPKVDRALSFHVGAGNSPVGICAYNDKGAAMFSSTGFKINIKGKGSHGATPHEAIDSINIAVHIYLALQELIARETNPSTPALLTIGQLSGGSASNIIPETTVMQGTMRTVSKETDEYLKNRIVEVAKGVAATFRGEATISWLPSVPPLIADPEFTREMIKYMKELNIPGFMAVGDTTASASEDFAIVLSHVPGTYMFLSAGFTDRESYTAHNPKVLFNEDVLPEGSAFFAHCATRYLENSKK